jgi:hypothetical protein
MSDLERSSSVDLDRVIDDLMHAYRLCHQSAAYCIDHGGRLATLDRLKAFDDCAEVNLTLANFLLRGSEHAVMLARVCIEVSASCAHSIEDIEHSDPQLRAAFAVCHRARHACLQLLGEERAVIEDERDQAIRESFPASDPPPTSTEI